LTKIFASGLLDAAPAGTAEEPSAPDDETRRQIHLQHQQLKMLCTQATRSPFAVTIAVVFVAIVVWEAVPAWKVLAWAAALMVFPVVRGLYSSRALRKPPADAARGLQFHVVSTLTGGIVVGLAAPLFFEPLTDERRAFLTMILVCWAAAGVSAMAAYARAYYAYVAPVMLQLAAAWAVVEFGSGSSIGTGERFLAASLILFAGVIQAFFARDGERVLRESFRIRYENERLIAALERERQEVALARDKAEAANRAKSRFLAAASHDLRQPLTALSLNSATLAEHATEGVVGEISRSIDQAVQSLSALVDSLLDISKLDAGTITPEIRRVGVRELLNELAEEFRGTAARRGLRFQVAAVDAAVDTDPILLERILRNLVDNAFKYTAAGSVALTAEASGSDIRFAVRDTGSGIPAHERSRIFEEFYQIGNPQRDRAQGLGLGLAIVRRLAALLGSDVELESEPGRGTEFALRIPRSRHAPAARRQPPRAQPGASALLSQASVLVIDDEADILQAMRGLLEKWGCRVTVAGAYAEAERLLDRHALGVDLIIADFRLRANENGERERHRDRAPAAPAHRRGGAGDPDERRYVAGTHSTGLRQRPAAPAQAAAARRVACGDTRCAEPLTEDRPGGPAKGQPWPNTRNGFHPGASCWCSASRPTARRTWESSRSTWWSSAAAMAARSPRPA
jgi:two-component system, sensor histidine kinase